MPVVCLLLLSLTSYQSKGASPHFWLEHQVYNFQDSLWVEILSLPNDEQVSA